MSSQEDLSDTQLWFLQNLNRPVLSVEIGNGRLDSVFKPMSWQLDRLTEAINSIDYLRDYPFHLIGFSQGGLLARAFAETSEKQRVKTLLTFGTPHMGVYYYSDEEIYSPFHQSHLSYSNYWKDPYMFPLYLKNSTFLPSINGEIESGLNLNDKVDDFVMVWSPKDEVIRPIESGKYEFYDINTESVVPFLDSNMFKNDYIGIRKMFEENRVHFVETDCAHKEYKSVNCLERHKDSILKYLM
jgi:palmitoyl-protein thioesterase